jgi:hypothetical protein
MKFMLKYPFIKLTNPCYPDPPCKRVIKMWKHKSWGDSIIWDEPNTRIMGWLENKPDRGDKILSKMKSGKIGIFRITNVEHCRDPNDMFFADVMFDGYEEK